MEEDKRGGSNRRRALELLEAYKSKRSNVKLNNSLDQVDDEGLQFIAENEHDEESLQFRSGNQSMDQISMSNNESGMSSALCSVSMSEGEGDGELEGLAGRVTELRELLQGKEAVVEALHAEIDDLRVDVSSPTSSHSQNSNKDTIPMYLAKLHEYEKAVNQRDNLIEDLTTSLQQALASRDAALAQIKTLSQSLENSSEQNESDEKEHETTRQLENEKEIQSTELSEYKDQVENLNKKIRADSVELDASPSESSQLHLIYQEQIEKIKKDMKLVCDKFAAETLTNNEKHEKDKKELVSKYESELLKLREENKNLEIRHTKEMSVFQSQLINYKRTVDSLKSDLVTRNESQTQEKELLNEQIKLHKLQLDEITTKYVATASVLDSKESIERSLEQALTDAASLRTENENLKFKIDDLSLRYTAAQSLIENNMVQERTLSEQIFSLQKSLSRLSGTDFSITELDATTYQLLDNQCQMIKQQLDEKTELEKELVKKIKDLEELVMSTKAELEETNLVKDSYEKQIKDMKNTCDRLMAEINANYQPNESLDKMLSIEFEREVLELKKAVDSREKETAEYIKRLEELEEQNHKLVDESDKLKKGLVEAYAQCAAFEEKLDQTLGFGDSKLGEESGMLNVTVSSNASSIDLEEVLHRQKSYNTVLRKLDACHEQIKEYEELAKERAELLEKAHERENQLREEIKAIKIENSAEAQRFKQVLSSLEQGTDGLQKLRAELEARHTKEMEGLRTYFEQKCLQMEKQYSEEIFSQQSKKMSDNDSEIEELTDDLYMGGGGDAQDAFEKDIRKDVARNNEQQNNNHDERLAKIATDYEEKLENLRKQLRAFKEKSSPTETLKAVNQCCQTELSGVVTPVQENCNELNELRADYHRQLEEQVGLARVDIINALQQQIEALITSESDSDENWPSELLELRNKFTSNSKREIQSLKERHSLEVKRIKEEHNQIIHLLQDEIKQIKLETHESLQSSLIKERDTLHKTCATLKGLVAQLIEYCAECEEELNNTLINEVLRKQYSPRSDVNIFEAEGSNKTKRVRFAPHSSKIASIVGSDSDLQELINSEKDIMKILKKDLDACLEQLKADSAKILNVSISDSESWSTGIGDTPSEKLLEAEKILSEVQEENEHLKVKIIDLQQRLIVAENKKEIVTEGYGEQDGTALPEEAEEDFSQLQDRAKFVVMNGSNDTAYLLQLIDELCRHADKSIDDIKKEKEDLQNQQVSLVPTPTPNNQKVLNAQIEAADKQLRSMRKFQEEQANERELERDEASKQVQMLQERLREREREKDRDYRITSAEPELSPASSSTSSSTLRHSDDSEIDASVEALTAQVHTLETRATKAEGELKIAVSKIWNLREIIRNLEQEVQTRAEREEVFGNQIKQLEDVIDAQTKNQHELVQELEIMKSGSENNHLSEHIGHLQEELRKHQLSSEQLTSNSSALRQLRLELRELQNQLNKKTRELESIHVCGSSLSLSQPSEDISIRDQLDATRSPTPDEPNSPPVLPLDHVLKLKDNLMKHFRAEDVALKRLKDLDLQLGNLQRQNEDLLAEQEIYQQTTSEQLFQIETLRARLEQQKQTAPFAQRQATSKLESQLFEVNDKLEVAERALIDKDIELAEVKGQLERMSRMLADKENEITNFVKSENEVVQKLKHKLLELEDENKLLQAKLNVQEKGQNLPQVIDNLLADKNAEIDHLRQELSKYAKQLDVFQSYNDIQLPVPKNSARTLSDILSIHSEEDEIYEGRSLREAPHFTRSQNVSNLKMPNSIIQSTMLQGGRKDAVDFSQPITETPKVPLLELLSSSDDTGQDNLEISKEFESLQMHLEKMPLASPTSHTDAEETQDDSEATTMTDQENFCPKHGPVSKSPNRVLNISADRRIQELESHLYEMRGELNAKSAALEQRNAELLDIQNHLDQLQKNIASLNQDRLYYKVEYEKAKESESKIQKDLLEVENELKMKDEELEEYKEKVQSSLNDSKRKKRNELALHEKIKEIANLKQIISEKDITIETLQFRNSEIEQDLKDLDEYRRKFELFQQEIASYQGEIQRLSDSLNNRDHVIRKLEEMARRSSQSMGSSSSEKDQEIFHLQEYLKEKDNVIRQMSDDSKSLQRALEAIQSKMKESGNVVELRRKLKEERKLNVELREKIAKLRTELEIHGSNRRVEEENDITEMVQRELNLSAKLDQQLLNVIDSEPEENVVIKNCEDLKEANKEIDELNRFNDDLEIEREMLKSQLTEYENRIMQLKSDVEVETKRIAELEEELSKEKHLVRSLQMQLQREKMTAEENKMQDTELITTLRIKLSEALEVRDKLIMERKNMEIMNSLQSQKKTELTDLQAEMKKEQLALVEKLEAESRKNEEAREIIKKLEADKERLQSQIESAESEIEKLTSSLSQSDFKRDQLHSDLQRAKEDLKAKAKENEWQKSILQTMSDAEEKRKQQKSTEHSELKSLRRQLKNTHDVLLDFEADMKSLKEQLTEAAERESQLTRCIESLTDKETELTEQLTAAKSEDNKLRDIIADQQNEIKIYLKREIELADVLKKEKWSFDANGSPNKVLSRFKGLNATVERLTQDKVHLYEKVAKLREENERYLDQIRFLESQQSHHKQNSPTLVSRHNADSDERLQHFYGKYLRSDSRRKALIFQKSYLLCIIAGYQHAEENTLAFLSHLTMSQRAFARGKKHQRNPRVRFRSVVFLIISTLRMKWLILRWRTGKRVGANVVLGVGAAERNTPRQRNVANGGHSPPVRERTSITNGSSYTTAFSYQPYYQRLSSIQNNLHLRVPDTTSDNFKLE